MSANWEVLICEVIFCIYVFGYLYDKHKELLVAGLIKLRHELDLLYEFWSKTLDDKIEKYYEQIREKVDQREGSTLSDSYLGKFIETNYQKHKNVLSEKRKAEQSTKKTFHNIGTINRLNQSKKMTNIDCTIDSIIPRESSIERNKKIKNDLLEAKSHKEKAIKIIEGMRKRECTTVSQM